MAEDSQFPLPYIDTSGEYRARLVTETVEQYAIRVHKSTKLREKRSVQAKRLGLIGSNGQFISPTGLVRSEEKRARTRVANRIFRIRRKARIEALAAANVQLLEDVRQLQTTVNQQSSVISSYRYAASQCYICSQRLYNEGQVNTVASAPAAMTTLSSAPRLVFLPLLEQPVPMTTFTTTASVTEGSPLDLSESLRTANSVLLNY